ncbi:MAG: hypothetical protein HFJ08_06685 [Lachnospiraceae bacterium]|nr:hypothetical protein [Lachnospiraceae bacterium]
MKQHSGRDVSSHHEVVFTKWISRSGFHEVDFTKWFLRSGFHEVVLHGLMFVTGSQRLNCYNDLIQYNKFECKF